MTDKPLYEQLYLGIKTSDYSKKKLHSERNYLQNASLADFLNISQTTIELAYGQLLAEGYIMSKAARWLFR